MEVTYLQGSLSLQIQTAKLLQVWGRKVGKLQDLEMLRIKFMWALILGWSYTVFLEIIWKKENQKALVRRQNFL